MQPRRTAPRPGTPDLSTTDAPTRAVSVDNSSDPGPAAHWLGVMAPKRHARRAVTRNLVKRLARQAFAGHERGLPHGLWLVRLRQPISRSTYVSARSDALALALRSELEALIAPLVSPAAAAPGAA